ncbi:MAG: transcriptional regulator, GntR family [Chthonomonadaceae bacterium]|nr:transcriptional regulator, GntR family [Chthonomonadaceae bacterium]
MDLVPAYIRIADQIKAEWFSDVAYPEGKKLPTQEELAVRFGVSRSTIVRTLSRLTAEGYIHSQQGSGAYVAERVPRETAMPCVSLVVPQLNGTVIVPACRGVERQAQKMGFHVLLASSEGRIDREREVVEQHLQGGAKGVVLYPVTRSTKDRECDYLTHLAQRVPIVAMDIVCEEWPCSSVLFDNYRLSYEMTEQLLRHGHRHIAFMHITPTYRHTSIHDRQRGWMAAMQDAGQAIPPSYAGWPGSLFDWGQAHTHIDDDNDALAESLLRLDPRPDAVIAWTDVEAARLTQALIHLGMSVPEEIRLTGFDSEPLITRFFRPLFPTSRPDFVRLGELAVEELMRQMSGDIAHPRTYYYPVPVVWREPRTPVVVGQTAPLERSGVTV